MADKETKALEILCDGYSAPGNPNAYQVKPKAGQRCISLPKAGGPNMFFTEAQNGATLVIAEQPDGSLTLAHVEPGVPNPNAQSPTSALAAFETNAVRAQGAIQRADGSMAGQKCRVAFGPYQYWQLPPGGAPITSTTNVGYVQGFAGNAGVFGARDPKSGTWSIVAQVCGGGAWGAPRPACDSACVCVPRCG